MKVAVIGATGNAGSRIVRELLDREYEVTGIVRNFDACRRIPGSRRERVMPAMRRHWRSGLRATTPW